MSHNAVTKLVTTFEDLYNETFKSTNMVDFKLIQMLKPRRYWKWFMEPFRFQFRRKCRHDWLLDRIGLNNRFMSKIKLRLLVFGCINHFFMYDTKTMIIITFSTLIGIM